MVKIVNLTPHSIAILADGQFYAIPPSGRVARVEEFVAQEERVALALGAREISVPVLALAPGSVLVEDERGQVRAVFPPPEAGVVFLVSSRVATHPALRGRADVIAPDTGPSALKRGGQVVAVARFNRFLPQPQESQPKPEG